jgi:hypothetical protein
MRGHCTIAGCERPHNARGLCSSHYTKQARRRDLPPRLRQPSIEERFWSKVDTSAGPDGCWEWTAYKAPLGYGQFRGGRSGRNVLAHRFAYELLTGELLLFDLDHICHNPACVNPAHLRPVTAKQNAENLSGAQRNSKSGVLGVHPWRNRWEAKVTHNRKDIYVGLFATLEEAAAAVRAKRIELFTHNDLDRIGATA